MLIVYASKFGNTKEFVNKLNMRAINIRDTKTVNEPFVLVTFTFGFGEVPEEVASFLEYGDNSKYIRGVASGGNRNWGRNFGNAASIISQKYNVPILLKFELQGSSKDVEEFKKEMEKVITL